MEARCPCGTILQFHSQDQLFDKDEFHLVNHFRNVVAFNSISARISEALESISLGLKSGNERNQLISDLKIIARTCFIISEYTVGHYNRFGLPQSRIPEVYKRAGEVGLLIETELDHLKVQSRSRNQVLDKIL